MSIHLAVELAIILCRNVIYSDNASDNEQNGKIDDEQDSDDDGSISLGDDSDDDVSVFDGDEDDDVGEDIFEESDPEDEPKSKKMKGMSGKDFQKTLKNTDSE